MDRYCEWVFNEVESDETANPDVYDTDCGQMFCVDDDCYTREPKIPKNCYHCGKPTLWIE